MEVHDSLAGLLKKRRKKCGSFRHTMHRIPIEKRISGDAQREKVRLGGRFRGSVCPPPPSTHTHNSAGTPMRRRRKSIVLLEGVIDPPRGALVSAFRASSSWYLPKQGVCVVVTYPKTPNASKTLQKNRKSYFRHSVLRPSTSLDLKSRPNLHSSSSYFF